MAVEPALTSQGVDTPPVPAVGPDRCPSCGSDWGAQTSVDSALIGRPLRRCAGCGDRFALEAGVARQVVTCQVSGLPFYADRLLPGEPAVSPGCRAGRLPEAFADPSVVEATELEVRRALDARWSFVTEPRLADYLDRLLRAVAAKVPGASTGGRVALFDDRHLRALSLPSGTVLLGLGMLASLEDEAELVFVLAHELAHAASGDAGSRLVWLSMEGLSRETEEDGVGPWAAAAHEMIRLGHGRTRETAADHTALVALLELDYDPESVLAMLDRLQERAQTGSERARELVAAHPPAADRRREIERWLTEWERGSGGPPRVNRAVFRKAAGHQVLRSQMEPGPCLTEEVPPTPRPAHGRGLVRYVWLGIAVAVLTLLFLAAGIWLAG